MRILFLSNYFPPYSNGGYEQWCQEVGDGLRERGHSILVLTSRIYGDGERYPEPEWVHRELYLEMSPEIYKNSFHFFVNRIKNRARNLNHARQIIQEFGPDFCLVWGMWNLSRSLPAMIEGLIPNRVVYYVGDYWMTLPDQFEFYWERPGRNRVTAILKRLLRPIALNRLANESQPQLKFTHTLFPTEFVREELTRKGITFIQSEIIPGGIDSKLYTFNKIIKESGDASSFSILYAGRLAPEKGIETAIDAVNVLVHEQRFKKFVFNIVGGGDPSYTQQLMERCRKHDITSYVKFLGPQPKQTMAGIYTQSDILIFPSIWPEPFGRVPIEAMASGVIVIGTATGGAGEILQHNRNGLTFPPGDAQGLATQVLNAIQSPSLRERITDEARRIAVEKYDIHKMIDGIEEYLLTIGSLK